MVAKEDMAVAEGIAKEAVQVVASSSNLLNDTQYHILPLHNPGLKQTMPSEDPLHCVFPLNPSREGEEFECINATGEEKTPFVQSPPEGEETPCVQSPPGGKDSVCTVISRRGENSVCTVSGYIQPSSVSKCIYPGKSKNPASGGQAQALPSRVGKTRVPPVDHRAHKGLIQIVPQGTPQAIQGTLHNEQLHRL